tara:strand:+ start:483 stop:671 length:189 start_codon:yes stop_codon:yes gene_type:complete
MMVVGSLAVVGQDKQKLLRVMKMRIIIKIVMTGKMKRRRSTLMMKRLKIYFMLKSVTVYNKR